MLPFLHAAERDGWHHIVIDDESWFFRYIITSHVDAIER
jgi:hypothetical protein